MMTPIQHSVIVALLALSSGYASQDEIQKWENSYNKGWATLKHMAEQNATLARMVEDHFKAYNAPASTDPIIYSCQLPPSPSPPTSAHTLRPGDINVIGSLGDSITAGFGLTATNIIEVLLNDRQEAWVPGGVGALNTGVMTITNVLKRFNPTIQGFSFAESAPDSREAGLNVAVGGAVASDLYGQAEMLVDKMKNPSYFVDWATDWKLISVFIGGNDLCKGCNDPEANTPELYAGHIQRALDYLYNNGPPRTIIILSNIFDITPLPAFSDGIICDIVQWFVCSCAEETEESRERQRQYVLAVQEMLNTGRYDRPERPDFTVVYMPHFDESMPPLLPGSGDVDRSFWSPDCFHPGRKGHYAMATSQWNQLFEPVGQKRRSLDWSIGQNLICPTEENPYIRTTLNSGLKGTIVDSADKSDPRSSLDDHEQSTDGATKNLIIAGSVVGVVAIVAIAALVAVKRRDAVMKLIPYRTQEDEKDVVVEMKTHAESTP